MNWKDFLGEALVKGENLKDELVSDVLKSPLLKEILESELFVKAVTTALKTKQELTRAIRHNIKAVFQIMDVPSRHELLHLEKKLDHLEKVVDRVGKRAITVKSIKRLQRRKK